MLKRLRHDVKLSADITSETAIPRTIRARRPPDGILAEEGGENEIKRHGVWIVDPLDGTVNFSHGHPHFCVSIAWLWQGETVVGVIYDPLRDELFSAIRGRGAFCNGKAVHVAGTANMHHAMVAVGFGKSAPEAFVTTDANSLGASVQKLRISGSAALDLAYVACGRLDGYAETQVYVWDLAAGALIVEEAGGVCYMWPREELHMRSCVATGEKLSDRIVTILSKDPALRARTCLNDLCGGSRL